MVNSRGCTFVMPDGRLCRSSALRGEDYLPLSLPYSRGGGSRSQKAGWPSGGAKRRPSPEPMTSRACAPSPDIQRVLEVAATDTLALENSVARNRTLAYLSQTALKALEVGELEERLALLEAAVRKRDPSPASSFDLDLDLDPDIDDPKELTP